ncbi:Solute carrier family 25 member 40 [Sarcoptes scabiei]|nr:Solute carrier family 25 member 40 [Sarcoptes scabiei]
MSKETCFEISPFQQIISSCTGSFLTSILVTPLDVVKTRLQAQQKEFMKNKCFLYCNGLMDHVCFCLKNEQEIQNLWHQRPNHFNGTLDAMIKITRNEGITSLWSGLPPTLVMAVPATVMYFTIYDQLVFRLRNRYSSTGNTRNLDYFIPSIAGGSARLVAATVISPLEMIRTKMQSQRLSYKEIGVAVNQLIKSQGILGLWTGLSVTLLRDVPFSCFYWFSYENLKRLFKMDQYNFGFSFISGAISGALAATLTLPFDVVKTHRQIELGQHEILRGERSSKKTFDIMTKIYQERGFRGLFVGIVPRLVKVAPACALMISTYEAGKYFFRNYNLLKHQNRDN